MLKQSSTSKTLLGLKAHQATQIPGHTVYSSLQGEDSLIRCISSCRSFVHILEGEKSLDGDCQVIPESSGLALPRWSSLSCGSREDPGAGASCSLSSPERRYWRLRSGSWNKGMVYSD